jgi:hypothetical protein
MTIDINELTQNETFKIMQTQNSEMKRALDKISDIYMEERDAEMYDLFEVAQNCLAKLNVQKKGSQDE